MPIFRLKFIFNCTMRSIFLIFCTTSIGVVFWRVER